MNIIQSYVVNNPYYQNNIKKLDSRYTKFQTEGPKGIILHSVGAAQPNAKVFVNNWNNKKATTSVHAVLDAKGNVYQMMPWNFRAIHAGGSANNTHLGIEMTEPSTIKYKKGSAKFTDSNPKATKEHVLDTYYVAVELCADLCKKYNWNPLASGIIMSHSEAHKKGLASNHGDVEHLWSKFGLIMNQFRKDVKARMSGAPISDPTTKESYRVRVTANALHIRRAAGTMYSIVGVIKDKGVYTIVDEDNGWGLLKSYEKDRNGWISLNYTKRV